MKKMNSQATVMFMNICAAAIFIACSNDSLNDDIMSAETSSAPENETMTLPEAYGLTFKNFDTAGDVIILDADTTQLSVSCKLADKLGIKTFVNHPMGIWHSERELPYARKATSEQIVGDRYILKVEPATVAELMGDRTVNLNTSIYVNPDPEKATTRSASGIDMPYYAARYVDDNEVIHPTVILLTDPYGYDKNFYTEDDQPAVTRAASEGYNFYRAEDLAEMMTRGSAHKRILSLHDEFKLNKKMAVGNDKKDSMDIDLKLPIDFDLNYSITIDGGVRWKWKIIPRPYLKKFETGLDGSFAFKPEMTLGFKKKWELDEDKWKKKLCNLNGYTFVFMAGPVPIVVRCSPNLFLKLDGSITGQVSFGWKYEYENNFRCGIYYQDGKGWNSYGECKTVKNEFSFIRPNAKVTAEAGVGIYVGMDVLVYGIAGPEIAIGPRLGAEAELTASPLTDNFNEVFDFKAKADLSFNAQLGAKLTVMGWWDLAEYSRTIELLKPWTIWQYPKDN